MPSLTEIRDFTLPKRGSAVGTCKIEIAGRVTSYPGPHAANVFDFDEPIAWPISQPTDDELDYWQSIRVNLMAYDYPKEEERIDLGVATLPSPDKDEEPQIVTFSTIDRVRPHIVTVPSDESQLETDPLEVRTGPFQVLGFDDLGDKRPHEVFLKAAAFDATQLIYKKLLDAAQGDLQRVYDLFTAALPGLATPKSLVDIIKGYVSGLGKDDVVDPGTILIDKRVAWCGKGYSSPWVAWKWTVFCTPSNPLWYVALWKIELTKERHANWTLARGETGANGHAGKQWAEAAVRPRPELAAAVRKLQGDGDIAMLSRAYGVTEQAIGHAEQALVTADRESFTRLVQSAILTELYLLRSHRRADVSAIGSRHSPVSDTSPQASVGDDEPLMVNARGERLRSTAVGREAVEVGADGDRRRARK